MPKGYEMHVPCISEIYLGQGTCILNPGENPDYSNYDSLTVIETISCLSIL